jgi:hypothetical protein
MELQAADLVEQDTADFQRGQTDELPGEDDEPIIGQVNQVFLRLEIARDQAIENQMHRVGGAGVGHLPFPEWFAGLALPGKVIVSRAHEPYPGEQIKGVACRVTYITNHDLPRRRGLVTLDFDEGRANLFNKSRRRPGAGAVRRCESESIVPPLIRWGSTGLPGLRELA